MKREYSKDRIQRIIARQKELRAERKLAGLCTTCGRNPEPGMAQCAKCIEQRRTVWKAWAIKRRKERKDNGLCVRCGGVPIPGLTECQKCRDFHKNSWLINSEKWKPIRKAKHQALKLEVFEAYGGPVCACCGEKHMEFLSVDHVNNDGAKHRKEMGWKDGTGGGGGNIYGWLKTRNFPPGFRVLCMNCNFALGHGGTCPHQT